MVTVDNQYLSRRKEKRLVSSISLILIAFATAFFSRILAAFGAPSPINFLHFATIPFACVVTLMTTKVRNRKQINICYSILFGIFAFVIVECASALLNGAGFINILLDTLLLIEPFLLFAAIISLPISEQGIQQLRKWFERFVFLHLLLIYIQKVVLGYCGLPGQCDNIQGVFFRSGSGHVVGASVSVSFVIYYFVIEKSRPLWFRLAVLVAGMGNILAADAKQVLLTFIVGFAVLTLTKNDFQKIIIYVLGLTFFMLAFSWALQNVSAFSAFNTWIRPEIYASDGEATLLKFSGIRIALQHFHTPANWLLGLGPGHTFDRLGGWMLKDYSELLSPLGATRTTIGDEVWEYLGSSWLATGSSMFSPFWGWAAMWGDLGVMGLLAYLYLASIIWRKLCLDDVSRLLLLTIMTHGFILTQLEEPGYMLSMAMIIGIRWYERTLSISQKKLKLGP